LTPPCYLDVR